MLNVHQLKKILLIWAIPLTLQAGEATMKIWYLPFRIETITAVMMENMEKCGADMIVISDTRDINRIESILRESKNNNKIIFNEGRVRAKIIYNSVVYYIDSEGNFLSSEFSHGKVDKLKFEKIIEKYER
ncbi:hypothetical protein [Geothrix limicola]|uniref:hypothetical protein n=1 Tax=Geothrix limicola TaxID=2927978 RepID=UPI002554547D|nr:hypothetical protein [Geothrix limicola]